MPIPLVIIPFALVGLSAARTRSRTGRAGEGKVRSNREDWQDDGVTDALLARISDDGIDLLTSLGVPYVYGAGSPASPFPGGSRSTIAPAEFAQKVGWDCAGHAQAVAVRLGNLSSKAGDRGSKALSVAGSPVAVGSQRLGDLAFYGTPVSHVMTVLTDPDETGDSWVIGASGGTSKTFGQVPQARIKVFRRQGYRGDFRFFRRL